MNIKKLILVFFMLLNILVVSAQDLKEDVGEDPCEGLTVSQCKAAKVWVQSLTPTVDPSGREYYTNELIILNDDTSQEDLGRAKQRITGDFTYAIDVLLDYKGNLEDAQSQGLFGTFDTVNIFPDYDSVISELNSKKDVFTALQNNIMSQGTGSELRDLRASARDDWMGLVLIERYAYLRIQPARLANLNDGTADATLKGNINDYLSNHFNTYPEYSVFVDRAVNNKNIYDPDVDGFAQSWMDSAIEWRTLWFARLAEIAPSGVVVTKQETQTTP